MKHELWSEVRSWIAILLSLIAVAFSGWQLRPGRLVGDISYVVIWRFSSNNDGKVTDVAMAPSLWVQNIGARALVVKDLRMVLAPKGQPAILSFPSSSVPLQAVETPAEFTDYGRIASGSPFHSFALAPSQTWSSSYRFNISMDDLAKLTGEVDVKIQTRLGTCPGWKTVLKDSLDFGSAPYHLRPMIGNAQSIPVYTHRWSLRK